MSKVELSEHDIQRQILDWLSAEHIFHWRNNTGAMRGSHKGKRWFVRFGPLGAPDIIAVIRGQIYGIEVKRPNGMLSDEQLEFSYGFCAAGGKYIVASDLSHVEAALKRKAA